MEIDSYKTIVIPSEAELKVSKSKFISQVYPVTNTEDVNQTLTSVRKKYYDAAHHPYAYRLGLDANSFRYSDDGEPSGSAGKPIMEVIDKFELTDTLIVVTRYFGGVKLGVGGLRRGIFEAAELAIQNSEIITKHITEDFKIEFDYKYIGAVMNFLEKEQITILFNTSDEKVKLECSVIVSKIEKFKDELGKLTNASIVISTS
ncbi:MAG: YigZ family protein [Ignavibacteria bacterium]|nr:YigZ family protein [Ignavibacteria bacterium]